MAGRILEGKEFQPTNKTCMGEFLFNCIEKYEDRICQIDADLDVSETYSSVKQRAIRVALNLSDKGISSGDIISFCSYNSLDNGVAVVSAFFLGAIVTNLDPSLSARNSKHLLKLVSPRIIFVDESSVPMIEKCLSEADLKTEIIVFGKSVKYLTFSTLVQSHKNENKFRPPKVNIHDIALMFFSSGTTGLPKAICHSHYSFLAMTEMGNLCEWFPKCTLHYTTFYWISGLSAYIRSIANGGIRVFARVLEGEKSFKIIELYKVTAIFVAPIQTYEFTSVSNTERFDLSSLRCLLTGGTAMNTEQQKKLYSIFPNAEIVFAYAMSEIGVVSAFHPVLDKDLIQIKTGSCGKITPGISLKIVNPNTNELLPPNENGELRVKSEGLMKTYYHMESSDCFDEDGFFKTGDLGYYDEDNCIYVTGRLKEIFKYKAWHIVPSVIEMVLLEHPFVKDAAVFGIPAGEDGEFPTACVVLKENCVATQTEINEFVNEKVSDRERLRGGVFFVTHLPKTPTGKLIRSEVKNMIQVTKK